MGQVKTLNLFYGKIMKQIPLSRPDITELEKKIVCEVLNTPYLSMGPKTKAFEREFIKYFGVKHAVAVSSGTAGLHVLVKIAGIWEGDEVITSPFSFISSSIILLVIKATEILKNVGISIYLNRLRNPEKCIS